MGMKVVISEEQVTKVARTSIQLMSGEIQKRVTATLKCGVRVVMREGEVMFQRVGLFLQQGDILSFEADEFRESSFKPEAGVDRTISLKEVTGINLDTLVVKAGLWDEAPLEGLTGRSVAADFAPPRTPSVPPVSGQGNFVAAPPVGGAEQASSPVAQTQF